MSARGDGRRVPGLQRGVPFEIAVDGEQCGLYCGMGVCGECAVAVGGEPGVRACVTIALPGMVIATTAPASARRVATA